MKNLGVLKHFVRIYTPGSGAGAGPKNFGFGSATLLKCTILRDILMRKVCEIRI
jgi:hypothetical protein